MQLEELKEFCNQARVEATRRRTRKRKTAKAGRVKEMTGVGTTGTNQSDS